MTRGERRDWLKWCVATGIAASVLLIGGIQFVQASVYSRQEGEDLERQIDQIRKDHAQDKAQHKDELHLIHQKIDKIYELMIEKKN